MADYPAQGSKPWDSSLKAYIDDEVASRATAAQGTLAEDAIASTTARDDTATGPVGRIDITDPGFDSSNPNLYEVYVNGVLAGYTNEQGFVRGVAIHADPLVRGIRTDQGFSGSGAGASFNHIRDDRTGGGPDPYDRRWNGDLYRNEIKMADVFVRQSSGDPIPPDLPPDTPVITKG